VTSVIQLQGLDSLFSFPLASADICNGGMAASDAIEEA